MTETGVEAGFVGREAQTERAGFGGREGFEGREVLIGVATSLGLGDGGRAGRDGIWETVSAVDEIQMTSPRDSMVGGIGRAGKG